MTLLLSRIVFKVSCGSLKTKLLSDVSNNLASPPDVPPTLPLSSILDYEVSPTGFNTTVPAAPEPPPPEKASVGTEV